MLIKKLWRWQTGIWLFVLLMVVVLFWWLLFRGSVRSDYVNFGATFSKKYALDLGLDWKKVYLAVLDDLQIKRLRIPVYWDDLETKQGHYQYQDLDWMLRQASLRKVSVILAIGRKLPRWPECHQPAWTKDMPESVVKEHVLGMEGKVVQKYKNNNTVEAWQVENEPFFPFGQCPRSSVSFLKKEISLVKKIDSQRPVIITDSGELSSWIPAASLADILGISLYRISYNKFFGLIYYPLNPSFYRDRVKLIKPFVSKVLLSEVQAEPWFARPVSQTPLSEQYLSMNELLLENNFEYVAQAGFNKGLLWGVEWWYWLKEKGDSSIWNKGRQLIKKYKFKK